LGKPVILEEFGVSTIGKDAVYKAWFAEIERSGLAGDLIW